MSERRISRRQFVTAVGTASSTVLAGCAGSGGTATTTTATEGTATVGATDRQTTDQPTADRGTTDDADGGLVGAIERAAVPVELGDPGDGLDAVAADLAAAPVVGVGENSHGVREFKTAAAALTRRLVADHGYRLVAIEGTLGEFGPVNDYVTGDSDDLDAAMADLAFYFWRTPELRELFEWLRSFNADRPAEDRAVVHGYDAQFHDVNAAALRSYFERVDPAYLRTVEERLDPLARPLYEREDAEFVTDERTALLDDLRERLRARESAYVEASSRPAWELARRHVRTLERGLQFFATSHEQGPTQAKTVRDRAMAENVTWLREWTGADRAVVLGNSNHTMRGATGADGAGARMGQHLTDELGDDYYSLGLLFGTGQFRAPTGHEPGSFSTFDLGGPLEGTPAATFADASAPQFFLDFDAARDSAAVGSWLDDTGRIQFTVPRVADRGAVPLPAAPGAVYDGTLFARSVSPAAVSR